MRYSQPIASCHFVFSSPILRSMLSRRGAARRHPKNFQFDLCFPKKLLTIHNRFLSKIALASRPNSPKGPTLGHH